MKHELKGPIRTTGKITITHKCPLCKGHGSIPHPVLNAVEEAYAQSGGLLSRAKYTNFLTKEGGDDQFVQHPICPLCNGDRKISGEYPLSEVIALFIPD